MPVLPPMSLGYYRMARIDLPVRRTIRRIHIEPDHDEAAPGTKAMSDFLGAMLGLSPPWLQAQIADYNARVAMLAPPKPPEPGITWQQTGGKTWRVTITG